MTIQTTNGETSTVTHALGEIFTPKALGRMARNRRYCAKEEMAAAAAYLKGFRVWSLVFESGQIVTSEVIPRTRVGRHVAVAACSDLDEWSQSEGIRVAAGRALAHYLKRSRLPRGVMQLAKSQQWVKESLDEIINGKAPRGGAEPKGLLGHLNTPLRTPPASEFKNLFEEVLIAEHDAEEAQQEAEDARGPEDTSMDSKTWAPATEGQLDALRQRLERLEEGLRRSGGRMTRLAGQTSTKLDDLTERIKHLEHRQAQLMYVQDVQGTRIGQLEDQQATNDPSDRRS